jgi:glutaconate CoA-transferase, subunit A
MVSRYVAGASGLPFMPLRSYFESDLPKANAKIVEIASPFGDESVYAVPPLNPDVAIVHVQRADEDGNAQIWGFVGCQKEAAFAAERVIVVCEELVDDSVVRADPNRTMSRGRAIPRSRRAITTATIASTSTGIQSRATRTGSSGG